MGVPPAKNPSLARPTFRGKVYKVPFPRNVWPRETKKNPTMAAGTGKKLMRVQILTSEQCLKLGYRGITTTEVITLSSPPRFPPVFYVKLLFLMQEFLSANMLDLMTALSLSYCQLLPLLQAMSHTVAPHPTNVHIDHYLHVMTSSDTRSWRCTESPAAVQKV